MPNTVCQLLRGSSRLLVGRERLGSAEGPLNDQQYLRNVCGSRGPKAHEMTNFVRPTPATFLYSALIQ
jgi:hypothetical protein